MSRVREVNQAYAGLERHRLDAAEVLRNKFAHAFWRRRELLQLAQQLPDSSPEDQVHLVDALSELQIYIPEDLQRQLAGNLHDQALYGRLMARQGIRTAMSAGADRTAGPGVDLNIKANRSSAWPFEKWRQISAFSEYDFEGDGVNYRGVLFRPGDTVLCNANLDGNGVYTALSDPKNFCSHSAVVAVFEYAGRRFPAVVETYEKGLRAVPLNVFLGPRFSSYTEVYRHRALTREHAERINALALEAIRQTKGYNFYTEDPAVDYLSCTRVGRMLMAEAGLAPVELKSRIADPRIQDNLQRLGYRADDFFSTVDYLLNESMRLVGWIDNNQFDRLVSRELVETRFRELFAGKDLRLNKLPFKHRLNLWGIGHLRRRTVIGRVISLVQGFDHISLPKGPDPVIALVTIAEALVGRAIEKVHPFVADHVAGLEQFELDQVIADRRLRSLVDDRLDLPWLI